LSTMMFYSLLAFLLLAVQSHADIFISEVSDQGAQSVCNGEDWVELYNSNTNEISLEGYLLFDDKGPFDSRAYSFGADASIPAEGYLLLCCNGDGLAGPAFKIGGDDTITLRDNTGVTVDSSGILPDVGAFDVTYARNQYGELVQTTTPTPGATNSITERIRVENDYRAQNALGSTFFGLNDDGTSVEADAVIDLHARVDTSNWESLRSNPYTETYIPVQEFKIVTSQGSTILSSPGRMRTKGQSTLVYPICMNEDATPFKLDFGSTNATQTLFGVGTAYLRTHLSDNSHMREWATHRMLARFGLPFLRTRQLRFFVNDVQLGFYTFVEALDQDNVMARTFNYTYDKDHKALYKVKTMSLDCGNEEFFVTGDTKKCTSPDGQGGYDCCATIDWNEPKTCAEGYYVEDLSDYCWYTCVSESPEAETGPYAYERGDHRDEVRVHEDEGRCWTEFWKVIGAEVQSVRNSFYDAGYTSVDDCGDFLLSHDLVDRDLGKKEWDAPMKDFINSHLSANGQCIDDQCSNKRDIQDQIDVDNWLKNFAVYAVIAEQDSPMGNGNNYFLATAGDSTLDSPKWKMVQYDHNNNVESAADVLCESSCSANGLEGWSVVRPTCRGLSENPLVGPILLDPDLHARYLSFVREFVETVYTNESFLRELREHYQAISTIAKDSPDFDSYGPIDGSKMFDWMEMRGRKVLEQLVLWDNDQFPEFASIDSTEPCVSLSTEYFPDKCTSPDGLGGYDCCATLDWGELKTCALGYKVKKLDNYCNYTCVEGLSAGVIVGITIGAIALLALLVVAVRMARKSAIRKEAVSSENPEESTSAVREEAAVSREINRKD